MPRSTLLIWPLAALVAACIAPSTAPPAPAKIVFPESVYDFGHAEQGGTVTHTYTFQNAGGLDLSIDNVRAACGCTAAVAAGRVIAPGHYGSIDARLDTTHDAGRIAHTITVYSNDPVQPVTTLTLAGEVEAVVAIDPPALYVGHVRRGQSIPNTVRLAARSPVSSIGSLETNGRVVDGSLRDGATGTAARQLQVSIKSDAPFGRFKDSMLVHIGPQRRVLRIPVSGFVDGDDVSSSGR